ncbi:homeobox protein abdominal-B, partial [Aplysia californica]|uniref:Homeobox protein abdominal-B n=1 Tax=Aplysia californica TaxID=6500 RepID=A0ABM1ADW6_APLCA
MSPSSLYQQQQQQHQNRLPPPPHHHQQQQHPSPHHHHQPYSQQQQQQQQFQLSGRGASLDSAVGPLPHTHAHPHHTPPPPTAGQDFYDSPKAYANEVYMDHRELSRSRAGGSGGGGGGGPGASSWDPTGYPPPTSSQQQQQMDRGRDEYASLQMPPGGYVRPRTDDEQLLELQRSRYRARSETRLS